ncbi:MAG: hypothetical protein WBM40_03160 [Thiohalocapsa sp.]
MNQSGIHARGVAQAQRFSVGTLLVVVVVIEFRDDYKHDNDNEIS